MNASYKIVLLGAFVLFAAVIGYYVFTDNGQDAQANPTAKPLANSDPDPPADRSDDDQREPTPPPTRPGTETGRVDLQTPPTGGETGEVTVDVPDTGEIGIRFPAGTEPDTGIGSLGGVTGLIERTPPGTHDTGGERIGPGATETGTTDTTDTDTGSTDIGDNGGDGPRVGPGDTGDRTTTEDTADTDTGTGTETETRTERPAPPRTGNTPQKYTVQGGDTFASIALKIYGEEAAWFDIAQANPLVDPKKLQVDQVIVLPLRDTTAREREEVKPPAPGNDQTYTVRPGDTLSGIAKKFYGDTEAWDLIYNRNRNKIGQRPDDIKVGMQLIIPQAYSGAE